MLCVCDHRDLMEGALFHKSIVKYEMHRHHDKTFFTLSPSPNLYHFGSILYVTQYLLAQYTSLCQTQIHPNQVPCFLLSLISLSLGILYSDRLTCC